MESHDQKNLFVPSDRFFQEDGGWWYRLPGRSRTRADIYTCEGCGVAFLARRAGISKTRQPPRYHNRDCSNKAYKEKRHLRGPDHPNWRGGHINKDGYRVVWATRADGSRKLVGNARLVMEAHLGRELLPSETVHHKNGVKDDDRLENLELWASRHPRGQRVTDA